MSFSILSVIVDTALSTSDSNFTRSSVGCGEQEFSGDADLLFYQLMIIPSGLEFILLSFLIKRKFRYLDKCGSRPGILYPMNIYEFKNRMSFIAAFGTISYLCYEVILNSKYIIPFSGHLGIRVFVILLSVICYGIIFLPIFAALTMRTPIPYLLGTLHVWVFTYKSYDDTFTCVSSLSSLDQFLIVLRDWPKLASITYLAISMPIRFILALNIIPVHVLVSLRIKPADHSGKDSKLEKIRGSLQGRHIRKLFHPDPEDKIEDEIPKEGCKGKLYGCCGGLLKPWIYRNNPNFKYSARILSVYFVCFILIYKISAEFLIFVVPWISYLLDYIGAALEYIGYEDSIYDTEDTKAARELLYALYYMVESVRTCCICATIIEVILSALITFHMISSYRKNLLGLFKGDNVHIPPASLNSNAGLMVGTMRYAGYQIGYTLWGYLIQWSLFFLLFAGIAFIVTLYRVGQGQIITDLIIKFWPVPITTIVLSVSQKLIAMFLFLQERGAVLAIDNRRGFFLFTYFVFFYNIFLGAVSCLLRIIKAIIIGALFLGRLDHSTLTRRFQFFDPGFDAYVGFIHMENAHLNPVLLTFVSILNSLVKHESKNVHGEELQSITTLSKPDRRELVIRRWQLACVLYYNPQLRVLRKNYILQRISKKSNDDNIKEKPTISPDMAMEIPEKLIPV